MELAASILHIIKEIFLWIMQTNAFSHLALKAYAESCSYALQDHKVLLKTSLEMKHAK